MVGFLTPKIAKRATPTPPTLGDPALDAARNDQLGTGQNVFGRMQTILTGGQGATQSAPVQKKVLLGG